MILSIQCCFFLVFCLEKEKVNKILPTKDYFVWFELKMKKSLRWTSSLTAAAPTASLLLLRLSDGRSLKKKSLTKEGIKKTKLAKLNSFDKTGERVCFMNPPKQTLAFPKTYNVIMSTLPPKNKFQIEDLTLGRGSRPPLTSGSSVVGWRESV